MVDGQPVAFLDTISTGWAGMPTQTDRREVPSCRGRGHGVMEASDTRGSDG